MIGLPLVTPKPRGQVKRALDRIRRGDPFGCVTADEAGQGQGHHAEQECCPCTQVSLIRVGV
jgi:hypothetical protein